MMGEWRRVDYSRRCKTGVPVNHRGGRGRLNSDGFFIIFSQVFGVNPCL